MMRTIRVFHKIVSQPSLAAGLFHFRLGDLPILLLFAVSCIEQVRLGIDVIRIDHVLPAYAECRF